MLDEQGGLHEIDEKESEDLENEVTDFSDLLVKEIEDSIPAESKDLRDVNSELDKEQYTEEPPVLEEDFFDSFLWHGTKPLANAPKRPGILASTTGRGRGVIPEV